MLFRHQTRMSVGLMLLLCSKLQLRMTAPDVLLFIGRPHNTKPESHVRLPLRM